MSTAVVSNVQYRLSEIPTGTLIKFRHTAFGLMDDEPAAADIVVGPVQLIGPAQLLVPDRLAKAPTLPSTPAPQSGQAWQIYHQVAQAAWVPDLGSMIKPVPVRAAERPGVRSLRRAWERGT